MVFPTCRLMKIINRYSNHYFELKILRYYIKINNFILFLIFWMHILEIFEKYINEIKKYSIELKNFIKRKITEAVLHSRFLFSHFSLMLAN